MRKQDLVTAKPGNEDIVCCDFTIDERTGHVESSIEVALQEARAELLPIEETIAELEKKPIIESKCDNLDLMLAASSGVLCGLIDIIFVGAPGKSLLGKAYDRMAKTKVNFWAKFFKCDNLSQLEDKFTVPYDQVHSLPKYKDVITLSPSKHHYQSLAHHPNLFGLFFSIKDQLHPTQSHFVKADKLIVMVHDNKNNFVLKGNTLPEKLFYGFVNWLGHLLSDAAGSTSSKDRGMGLPSPFWSWAHGAIAMLNQAKVPVPVFLKSFNEMSMKMFTEGYDARFQGAQSLPVLLNELIVRLFYMTRRLVHYFSTADSESFSLENFLKEITPFRNPAISQMLSIAHGTFLAFDATDALIRSLVKKNPMEFCMRINVVGVKRLAFSLFKWARFERNLDRKIEARRRTYSLELEKKRRLTNYIAGLNNLALLYDDRKLLTFAEDLKSSGTYQFALQKSARLSESRGGKSFKTMKDVDSYFLRRRDMANIVKDATEKLQLTADEFNSKIETLGLSAQALLETIRDTQNQFDLIRGMPAKETEQFDVSKKIGVEYEKEVHAVLDQILKQSSARTDSHEQGSTNGNEPDIPGLTTKAMGLVTSFGIASPEKTVPDTLDEMNNHDINNLISTCSYSGGVAAFAASTLLAGPIGLVVAAFAIVSFAVSSAFGWKHFADKKQVNNLTLRIAEEHEKRLSLGLIDIKERIKRMMNENKILREGLGEIKTFGQNYRIMTRDTKLKLGVYLNAMYAAAQLLVKPIEAMMPKYSIADFDEFLELHKDDPNYAVYSENNGIIVFFVNYFHGIELSEKDEVLAWKMFRRNKELLEKLGTDKKKFVKGIFTGVRLALLQDMVVTA